MLCASAVLPVSAAIFRHHPLYVVFRLCAKSVSWMGGNWGGALVKIAHPRARGVGGGLGRSHACALRRPRSVAAVVAPGAGRARPSAPGHAVEVARLIEHQARGCHATEGRPLRPRSACPSFALIRPVAASRQRRIRGAGLGCEPRSDARAVARCRILRALPRTRRSAPGRLYRR